MKRWLTAMFLICLMVLSGCSRPGAEEMTEPMIEEETTEEEETTTTAETTPAEETTAAEETQGEADE